MKLKGGTIILGAILLGGGYFAYTKFIKPQSQIREGPFTKVFPPPQAARARAYAAYERKEDQPTGLWTNPYSQARRTNPRYYSRLVAHARALNARTVHSQSVF